jgi:hypothetical protein
MLWSRPTVHLPLPRRNPIHFTLRDWLGLCTPTLHSIFTRKAWLACVQHPLAGRPVPFTNRRPCPAGVHDALAVGGRWNNSAPFGPGRPPVQIEPLAPILARHDIDPSFAAYGPAILPTIAASRPLFGSSQRSALIHHLNKSDLGTNLGYLIHRICCMQGAAASKYRNDRFACMSRNVVQ